MQPIDRWRIAIFSGLLALAAGVAGVVVWKGAPFLTNLNNGYRWKGEMQALVARRAQIEADWNRKFGPLEEFPKRYPVMDDNETARKLDGILKGMGMAPIINPLRSLTLEEQEAARASGPEKQWHLTPDLRPQAVQRAESEAAQKRETAEKLLKEYAESQI